MTKNQFNIFEDDPKKMMDGLRKQYEKGFSDDMDRAAKILQEEYYKFLNEAATKGISGIFGDVQVVVKYKRKYKNIPRVIKVYIPDKGAGEPEIVFNVLNSGRAALGDAQAHGLKAWPMTEPRKIKFGNVPMTKPNSPSLQTAFSQEPIIFRRFQDTPIKPRNFVKFILENARKRIEEEGLTYVSVELGEQD